MCRPCAGVRLTQRASAVAVNSTLPPSWLPDAEWADSLEESLLTAGFPVNVVTLGLYLAPPTAANGVTQLLAAVPVQAPVTTAVEAVVQVMTLSSLTRAVVSTRALPPAPRGRITTACVVPHPALVARNLCVVPALLHATCTPQDASSETRYAVCRTAPASVKQFAAQSPKNNVCLSRSSRARSWCRSTATCRRSC